jgi:hypothetical protein
VFADNYGTRFFAAKLTEDLRCLAVESFSELNIAWNWLRPPVAFDVSIFSNVAHVWGLSF